MSDPDSLAAYGKDWIKDYAPHPRCIVFPRSTADVQAVLSFCNQNTIPIVPSGGRTGLSGGATATNNEVILSLERLNRTCVVNPVDRTITVDAGVITQKVQETAVEHGLYFPVDFSSKGSSHIGGNVATNAGGIRVIKYGNIRDWVLGLTVVLADGRVLELNGSLFKNNTGYDLRNLMIGSEGTLGVITQVTLRLTEPPRDLIRVLCGLMSLPSILTFLQRLRARFADISAFEFFPRNGLEKVTEHHKLRDPFPDPFPYYVLVEVERMQPALREELEEFLAGLMEEETLAWVVLSQNQKQLEEFMAVRELLPETLSARHTLHKNDISVPVPAIPEFIDKLQALLASAYQGHEVVTFGHIGDGNLHVNVLKPRHLSDEEFFRHGKTVDRLIFSLVQEFKGSISAEHGVGLLKREFISFSRSADELALMRGIKQVFDPRNILNPGKLLPDPTAD